MRHPRVVLTLALCCCTAGCGDVRSDARERVSCGAPLDDASQVIPEAPRERPPLGAWHLDPLLGGCIARVSEHAPGEALQVSAGRQAFSVDGRHVLTSSGSVLDADRFEVVTETGIARGVWSAREPERMVFVKQNALLSRTFDSEPALLAHFDEYAELEPLTDPVGDEIAIVGRRSVDGVFEIFRYDLVSRDKSEMVAGPVDSVGRATAPRWARISPSGKYTLVAWPEKGIEVYDAHMQRLAALTHGDGAGDVALMENGSEWYVSFAPSEHGPLLEKRRLPAGEAVEVVKLDWFHNVRVACQALGRGYCVVTTHGDTLGGWQPLENELFGVELHTGTVERLAHHHSDPRFVSAEPPGACALSPDAVLPNAALDRSGERVLFTSNWNAHCFGELYLIQR